MMILVPGDLVHRADWSSISYGAAKAGLLHLMQWAAVELGEDCIRVNSISPGGISTGTRRVRK